MAFFFFDYAKTASAFDKFDKDVKAAIRDINGGCKTSLTLESSARSSTSKFIPDYLINREGKPFLIIEYKSQLTSLSESIFVKGLSEWGTYGILTDGKTFKVYGRKSYLEIASYADLKSAMKYLIGVPEGIDNPNITENVKPICDFIIDLANRHLKISGRDKMIKLIEGWKKSSERFFEIENNSFVLTDDAEQAMFRVLLGRVKQELCRYSSFGSVFRMLKNQRIYLNNIMNMNDKTEGSYFDSYLLKSDVNTGVLANMMEYFIMSCSDIMKADDFDMWRLYGDDTKGCCLIFKLPKNNNTDFKIFPVSYGQKDGSHPEVDFLNALVTYESKGGRKIIIKNLNEWKLFFKPYEYHNEKEVRVLRSHGRDNIKVEEEYYMNEHYGIASKSLAYGFMDFPLRLECVILGANFSEKEANSATLEELLKECIKDRKVPIKHSECKTYRA